MFPFKPRKTRWEIARDNVIDVAHDAADNLQSVSHVAAAKASQAAIMAAAKAGTAATSASLAGKQILETVEDKLQHSGETAQHLKENLSESLSRGAHAADERAHLALDRAHEAAHTARQTAQTARDAALQAATAKRELLAQKKDDISHTLHDKSERARETAAQTAARLSRKREEAAESAADLASNVAESAQNTKSSWLKRGSEISGDARELVDQKKEQIAETTKESRKEANRRLKAAKKAVERRAEESDFALLSRDRQVEVDEGGSKTLWIIVGLAAGAVIALLMWPKIGSRNRAALQDKFDEVKESATETVHSVADKAADKAEDLSRRADGLAHEMHVAATDPVGTDTPVPETPADDITLADRVRSELGRTPVMQDLTLNIDSVEGNISVRGALPDMTTQVELESIIRAIPGVRDVIFDTPAPDAPPLEDSLNHQTEMAQIVTENLSASSAEKPEEQPKNESPADKPFVG